MVDEARFNLLLSLRSAVLKHAPLASEEVKYGGLLYSLDRPFCGLYAYTSHVSLEFSQGAKLPDPDAVLQGKGQFRRHLKLKAAEDIEWQTVNALVLVAYAIACGQ